LISYPEFIEFYNLNMPTTKDDTVTSTKAIFTNSANWDDWNDPFICQAIMYSCEASDGRFTKIFDQLQLEDSARGLPAQGTSGQGAFEDHLILEKSHLAISLPPMARSLLACQSG
jgi:hypothetical protein